MTKWEAGIETQATMIPKDAGFYRVVVIHRFDSGNFVKQEHDNQSQVAAEALLKFYTE